MKIPDVGENNRYCSDKEPGVGSVQRVSNKIILGRKLRLCLSNSYYKYWMCIISMFIILLCVTCAVLSKNLPISRLLKRVYSRGARRFIKLRFRALCRVALITTNFLCLFRFARVCLSWSYSPLFGAREIPSVCISLHSWSAPFVQ